MRASADLHRLLHRGVAEIIVQEELDRLLESGKPLRLKQGFDPSFPDIHLGHAVGLRKLRQFQELGHRVILIVGDWTAQIGDPSGRSTTRPMLSVEQVRQNAETYMQQFFRVVDRDKTEVRWQSEWFGSFSLADVIRLTSRFTVAQMLAREDFAKRYQGGSPIAITELLYPLLQAYDSVMIEADVEFGGTDQKFNCLVGRELQGMVGQRPQQVFLVPILVGTDGVQKMSKSLGNYIGIAEPPKEMYGKVMSLADSLILDYFRLLTDLPDEEIDEYGRQIAEGVVNPMVVKKRLARELVAQFHRTQAAQEAEAEFERVFQRREIPEDIVEYRTHFARWLTVQATSFPQGSKRVRGPRLELIDISRILVAANIVETRSEARRLIAQGAVEIDGTRIDSFLVLRSKLRSGAVVKAGKRKFVRLIDEPE